MKTQPKRSLSTVHTKATVRANLLGKVPFKWHILRGLILSTTMILLSVCSPETDHCHLAAKRLEKRLGIQAHYHTLKCFHNRQSNQKKISSDHKKLFKMSQKLAGLELQSLFLLPQQTGARQFPLDKAKPEQIRFIVQENSNFKNKYLSCLKKFTSVQKDE